MFATLEQLVTLRSQLATGLLEYFQLVIDAPDRCETLPAYMGGRTYVAVFVEPDVLKREPRPVPRPSRSTSTGQRTDREGDGPERERSQRMNIAAEAQDIGEDALYGERERETERRVAWAEECNALERGQQRCAVVLAPPGQGKSLLTQMTARALATKARHALNTQQEAVENVLLPIVVTLSALTRAGSPPGRTPEETLRRALAGALQEMGCPETATSYLVAHAHERRVWLFLDALDEAGNDEALIKFFTALKHWECRVILTSRPYGYERQRLPFDVTEYRLAPFSAEQARAFVSKRFEGDEEQTRMNELLTRSLSVQQVSQNPFLLTLLCWVAERHDLSADITRTQLYDRVVRDLLGLRTNGRTADVDDQRATEWLPVLTEIALTCFQENSGRKPIPSDRLLDLLEASQQRPVPLGLTPQQVANLGPRQQATYLLAELCQMRLFVPLTRDRALYIVPHRSFLEYLTACALARQANPETGGDWQAIAAFVDKKAWHPAWQEVIVLLVGKLNNPEPLLKLLADDKQDDLFRHRLALATLCLPELSSAFRIQHAALLDQITTATFSLWWQHTLAGTVQAVSPLTLALPMLGQVNARIEGEPLLSYLGQLLRAEKWYVRKAAAEAIGRLGSTVTTPEMLTWLEQLLRAEEWSVRKAAAEAIGRLGSTVTTPEMLTRLGWLLQDKTPHMQAATAEAIGRLGSVAATSEILILLGRLLRSEE